MELKRNFVSNGLKINSFTDIEPYYVQLLERPLKTDKQVWQWLLDWSELDSIVEEDYAWRYIKSTCNTADKEAESAFETFVSEIEPQISIVTNKLNKRFLSDDVQRHIDKARLFTMIREIKKDAELFREENVPLEAELQQLEQEFGVITSKMTVNVNGSDLTMQQASNYIKTASRDERKRVFGLMCKRRLQDKNNIDTLLDKLIKLRCTIAKNAGYSNFVDFRFRQLGRFDYTVEDCHAFHESIEKIIVPLVDEINLRRKKLMGVSELRPYDLSVDLPLGTHLKPFNTIDDLVEKACFRSPRY